LQALYFAVAINAAFELSINIGTETIADKQRTDFDLIWQWYFATDWSKSQRVNSPSLGAISLFWVPDVRYPAACPGDFYSFCCIYNFFMNTPLDRKWPMESLELVESCPYCGSNQRILAYSNVQDWVFNSAPGEWTYWDCIYCDSLYLDPRPTRSTIGLAYSNYYTHLGKERVSIFSSLKARLRNECLSKILKINIAPRLHIPQVLGGILSLVGRRVVIPFGWLTITGLPKGRFIDVGCGAGLTVNLAKQLGWNAMGLEIDPSAVRAARQIGLDILEGDYDRLSDFEHQFDCIMCSHVLEHIHDPRDLLRKLKAAIKPGGVLLLTLPNSLSVVRRHFGVNWRGLEAPRHLSIPSEFQLINLLVELGFTVQSLADESIETAAESFQIQRRGAVLKRQDIFMAYQLVENLIFTQANNDLIKLVCKSDIDSIA
jgi:2-polyprenyl-3-methyl-5-hydroxy-6-metoxy-1,4-benzoquinol methylase